jgi:hypothetical protein
MNCNPIATRAAGSVLVPLAEMFRHLFRDLVSLTAYVINLLYKVGLCLDMLPASKEPSSLHVRQPGIPHPAICLGNYCVHNVTHLGSLMPSFQHPFNCSRGGFVGPADQMAVNIQRHARPAVAEAPADGEDVHTGTDQHRDVGVPQGVERDRREALGGDNTLPCAADGMRLERPALHGAEDEG